MLDKELFRFLGRGREKERGKAQSAMEGSASSMSDLLSLSPPSSPFSTADTIPEDKEADHGGRSLLRPASLSSEYKGAGGENGRGQDAMASYPRLSPTLDMLRNERPSIFFNLLWHFEFLHLPTTFLTTGRRVVVDDRSRREAESGSEEAMSFEEESENGRGRRRVRTVQVTIESEATKKPEEGGAFKLMSLFTPRSSSSTK